MQQDQAVELRYGAWPPNTDSMSHNARMNEADLRVQLGKLVDVSLSVAESDHDLRTQEPSLVDIIRLVREHPGSLTVAEEVLAGLVPRLAEDDPACWLGLPELLAYSVYALGMPRVVAEAERFRVAALAKAASGLSGRPWEHARRCERVIEAASPDWEERDMFDSLEPPSV